MQTLLQNEDSDGVYVDNSHINAKFKFWVKSKGFQVGNNVLAEHNKKGAPGKPVLYVPVKSTVNCVCGACVWESPVAVCKLTLFIAAHRLLTHE